MIAPETQISNLVAASEPYRISEVTEVENIDGVLTHLVAGRDNKPKLEIGQSGITPETCPFCSEAIPECHLGAVDDWAIVGNKYASTDREVLVVSQEHTPNLTSSDLRTWMDISTQTGGLVTYTPARKSLPGHKHAPIFDYPESPLLSASTTRIGDGVSITVGYPFESLVIDGQADARHKRTTEILDRLYARERMHNIAISQDRTFILASKVIGKIMSSKMFAGICSTDDRGFFEYLRLPVERRDGSYRISDYSACDFTTAELEELGKSEAVVYPDEHSLRHCLGDVSVGAVLSLGASNSVVGQRTASFLGVPPVHADFCFITDSKSNFMPICPPPECADLSGRGLLAIVGGLTLNIVTTSRRLAKIMGHQRRLLWHLLSRAVLALWPTVLRST